MPSPFPGMDPYLEHPGVFSDFHDSFIIYLRETIQPLLPEPYFASTRSRVWVEVSRRYIDPDVQLHRGNGGIAPRAGPSAGGVAVMSKPRTGPVVVHVAHDERREAVLEILRLAQGQRQLVTALEVLSPSNKTPGEHGRDLYIQKQKELLDRQCHLVEIDLLRAGVHSTAVPLDRAIEETGGFDYHVCCHRFDRWEDYWVYPVQLSERLPDIAIPLLPGEPDVTLSLQAVFDRTYDAVGFRRLIDYRQDPVPALSEQQRAWAVTLRRDKE